jgi:type I restriction enzyme S subunit
MFFGDPLRATPRWPRVQVSELCESVIDCVNKTAPLAAGPTPFKMIRTSNVRRGRLLMDSVDYVTEDVYRRWTRRSVPMRGDVILTREAPLGEVALVETDEQIFLGQRLVQYRVNPIRARSRYLANALMSADVQAQLQRLGAGSTVEHVAVPECEALTVLEPPVDLQDRFVLFSEQQERLRLVAVEGVRQAEHLFASLLDEAFTQGQ